MIRNAVIIFSCFIVFVALIFYHRTEDPDMIGQEEKLYEKSETKELLEEKNGKEEELGEEILPIAGSDPPTEPDGQKDIFIKLEKPPFIK